MDIVARRIPAKFGLHPVRDVQVLTPMHRGPAGAGNLNAMLQHALTPDGLWVGDLTYLRSWMTLSPARNTRSP